MASETSETSARARVSADAGHPAARSLSQLESSQQGIRDATKWLVAAAAAVGAIVVAGLQLTSLPRSTPAMALALAGFFLSLLGVAVILLSAARVLTAGYTTLGELVDLAKPQANHLFIQKKWADRTQQIRIRAARRYYLSRWQRFLLRLRRPFLLAYARLLELYAERRYSPAKSEGVPIYEMLDYLNIDTIILSNGMAGTIFQLYEKLKAEDQEVLALKLRSATDQKGLATSGDANSAETGDSDLDSMLALALWRQERLEAAAGELVAFANQRTIEHKFERLKAGVQFGGMAVALGVGIFAVASKASIGDPLRVERPSEVAVFLSAPSEFAPECKEDRLTGVAIGGTWEEPLVVTRPSQGCPGRRLQVEPGVGVVVPVSPSPSASVSVSPSASVSVSPSASP